MQLYFRKEEDEYKNITKEESYGTKVIEIEPEYFLGGMNYFTGSNVERGIKLYISKVAYSDGFKETSPMNNVTLHLKTLKRSNKKELEKINSFVQIYGKDIAKLYDTGQARKIFRLYEDYKQNIE